MKLKRWCLATLGIWAGVCTLLVLNAAYHAREARGALDPLRGQDPLEIDSTESLEALRSSQQHLAETVQSLDALPLRPARLLPVVGRQIESARAIASTSEAVAAAVVPLLEEVEEARSASGDVDRIEALGRLSALFTDVSRAANATNLGPDRGLVRPLSDARAELEGDLVELQRLAEDGAVAANGLSSFLSDGDYLLLGGNNAEMRVGVGMFLSIGVLTASDGQLTLPGLTPADDLFPVPFGEVVDSDVRDRWGFLGPGDDYRKVGYSARFADYVAPQVLAMWESQTGDQLDGVVYLDPFALEALMTVLGPVTVDDTTLDGQSALTYMLQTQYEVFQGEENIDDRQDVLSSFAGQVATEFGRGGWDPVEVLRAMEPVVRERHLMVYSTDPGEQALWQRLGAAGELTGWETGAFVINNGASKLDPFLAVSVEIETAEKNAGRHVTMTISAKNNATPTLNDYALGPWEPLGLPRAGVYLGRFVAYAPALATNIEVTSGQELDAFGPDGQVWVLATQPLEISPGAVKKIVVEFDLPPEVEKIEILPASRFPGTEWRVDGVLRDVGQEIELQP